MIDNHIVPTEATKPSAEQKPVHSSQISIVSLITGERIICRSIEDDENGGGIVLHKPRLLMAMQVPPNGISVQLAPVGYPFTRNHPLALLINPTAVAYVIQPHEDMIKEYIRQTSGLIINTSSLETLPQ